ncbi:MAG: hypothetical protein ABH822_02535 [Patescibacteria group bacterium]
MKKIIKDCFAKLAMTGRGIAPALLLFSFAANFTLASALSNLTSTLPIAEVKEMILETIGIETEIQDRQYPAMTVVATAYSSTPDQTDETPFLTAANTSTRDGVIAANFLNFHTKVKIPELYGDKIFVVEDRMNKRYNQSVPLRIDIWLPNRQLAKSFGIKKVEIVIVD